MMFSFISEEARDRTDFVLFIENQQFVPSLPTFLQLAITAAAPAQKPRERSWEGGCKHTCRVSYEVKS